VILRNKLQPSASVTATPEYKTVVLGTGNFALVKNLVTGLQAKSTSVRLKQNEFVQLEDEIY